MLITPVLQNGFFGPYQQLGSAEGRTHEHTEVQPQHEHTEVQPQLHLGDSENPSCALSLGDSENPSCAATLGCI